jgi:hypothetical protein
VGEDERAVCYCQSTGTTDDTRVVDFTGWTSTDADHDVWVEVPADYKHDGSWDTSSGIYRGNRTGGNAGIQIRMNDVTLRGLSERSRTLAFKGTIEVRVTASNIHIEDCVVWELSGTGANLYGIYVHSITTGSVVYLRNCLVYNFGGTGSIGFHFTTNANYDIYMYYCSAIGCETGFRSGGSTQQTNAKNCFSFDNGTPYADVRWGNSTNCCHESGSGIGTDPIDISAVAGADLFEDYAGQDYRIKAGSPIFELGVNLREDANYPVAVDFEGEERHVLPTPHFDEYPAPLEPGPTAREELQQNVSRWSLKGAMNSHDTYHPTS